MGSSSSRRSYSSSSAVCRYDESAAEEARSHHKSDFTSPEALVDKLQPGDLIQMKGNWLTDIFYSHWAVYAGNGDVYHVQKDREAVVRDDMVEAFSGKNVRKNNILDETHSTYSSREIIKRARGKLGYWDYSLFSHNCEHFAAWCRYGIEISLQTYGWADVTSGHISASEYVYYNCKSVKEKCSTLFSWIKRKVFKPVSKYITGPILDAIEYS